VADPRAFLEQLPDDELGRALRELAGSLAVPVAAAPGRPDIATRVRARLAAEPPVGVPKRRWGLRPMRRGLVLALAALLILAAVVGAVGLGLPGLRIIFGDIPTPRPTASPTRSPSSPAPLGSFLGLGTALTLGEAERAASFDMVLPTDPAIGPPDASYIADGRVALVWASDETLPPVASGIGLIINEFQGDVDEGYYQKIVGSGTRLTKVTVGGSPGYWISGAPHFFFYVDPSGKEVDDSHRVVGDTLIWTTGGVTYRIETSLGMQAAIRLAESLE
jgi:hypothetical protein